MAPREYRSQKIQGGPKSTGPADPTVLARRKFHKAAARWCAKWLIPLQVFFALIGFFVVLLPALSKPWRSIVESNQFSAHVFQDYSTFSGWALVNLFAGMLAALVKTYCVRNSPIGFMTSYKEIVRLEAYPREKEEEFAFWIDVVGTVFVTTAWLFLPFGVLAYFIRIGG